MNFAVIKLFNLFILSCLVVLWSSCATPTSPTGGPPDKEGPVIIRTTPKTGTTNFSKKSIEFEFSEFVDRASMLNAITIEPDLDIGYSLNWGRKSVAIEFDEKLPDLTTLIISIGTDLKDVRGNKISTPEKIAVSTGPEIDKGKLFGKVLDAQTGKGSKESQILLYRTPVDLSQKASYSAETDTSGIFQFSYLRQGRYKAFWVDDRNRNRIWDRGRERAQPFYEEFIQLKEAAQDSLGEVYITRPDTTQPILQGVGLFSSQRLRMRFSESIKISDSTSIVVTDTVGNAYAGAYPLYISPSDPYVLFAQSPKKLMPEKTYGIKIEGISDLSENPLQSPKITFTGSAQQDTTAQRIVKQAKANGLFPDEFVEIIYAKPIANAAIRDSIKVVEGTELIAPWPYISINRNKLHLLPNKQWNSGVDYELRIWNPITNGLKTIVPNIWSANSLGTLNVQISDTTLIEKFNLSIFSKERGKVADTTFSKSIEIPNLPDTDYRIVVYKDINKNGQWDFGSVDPYVAPEPYFMRNKVSIKRSFTADLTVSFQNLKD